MRLSPDEIIFWQSGFFKLSATIVYTWGLMLILAVGSHLITRRLTTEHARSRWQNLLEIVVTGIVKQLEDVGLHPPQKYLGFSGTLFVFIATASLFTIVPWIRASHGVAFDDDGTGFVCAGGRPAVWYSATRGGRISQVLCAADMDHAAV